MKIGLMSPGDMGASVANFFVKAGFQVYSNLSNRSDLSKTRAKNAGIVDLESLESIVNEVDLFFSIIPPDKSVVLAKKVGDIALRNKLNFVYLDMNAISPKTSLKIDKIFKDLEVSYIDGSIIGGPPQRNLFPRFYVSGNNANKISPLDGFGIEVRVLSDQIGDASALKMSYASITKGTTALYAAALIVAKKTGVYEHFIKELSESQKNVLNNMKNSFPNVKSKAYRWIGEMLEISDTFSDSSISGNFHKGAADTFDIISKEFERTKLDNFNEKDEMRKLSILIDKWLFEAENRSNDN